MSKSSKIVIIILLIAIAASIIGGVVISKNKTKDDWKAENKKNSSDIKLEDKGLSVKFSDVILSKPKEQRKLIVSQQEATVSAKLTENMISFLDLNIFKKDQTIHYTGTGDFIVNLQDITKDDIIDDPDTKTLTIKIEHAKLDDINIDFDKIVIDDVNQTFFARGDVKLSAKDYNTIEETLIDKFKEKFNTSKNLAEADKIALEQVKEIYEPVVKAVDNNYSLTVEFK